MKALLLLLLLGSGLLSFGQTREETKESLTSKSPAPSLIESKGLDKKLGGKDPYVRGRVTDYWGRSISRATILVFCLDCEDTFVTRTNTFGHYKVNGLRMGSSYLISVMHGKHLFTSPSASFTADSEYIALDFEAGQ